MFFYNTFSNYLSKPSFSFLNSNKDCGFYNYSSTSYEVNNITENLISVTGKIGYDTCGGSEYYSVDIELSKNNDTWIVTKYVENN